MTTRTIVLIDEATRERALQAIRDCSVGGPHPLEVVIQGHKKPKTLDQLGMYFWLCDLIGREVGHTKDEMDAVFVEMFVPAVGVDLPGGHTVVVRKRPSKWDRGEASYVIERVLAFAGQEGIKLPPPPRYR